MVVALHALFVPGAPNVQKANDVVVAPFEASVWVAIRQFLMQGPEHRVLLQGGIPGSVCHSSVDERELRIRVGRPGQLEVHVLAVALPM